MTSPTDATVLLAQSLPGLPANLHWAAPWAFGLLLIPLALLLRIRRRPAVALPSQAIAARLPKSLRQRLLWLPRLLLMLSMAAGIVALARPQLGEGKVLTSTDAVAIQLVVDRSGSMRNPMLLDGQAMSRLDVVKRVVRDFLLGNGKGLDGRPADIVGLVQFALYADTACPMVRDHKALVQLVDAIQLALQRYEDGTSIGDGIALAAARLHTAEEDLQSRHNELAGDDFHIHSKIIILLTDGNDTKMGTHDPLEAAKLAAQWGIKVYTIGIDVSDVEVMRSMFGDQRIRTDAKKTLMAIADATGGKFFLATDGDTLRSIYTEIDHLEKSNVKTIDYTDYTELFTSVALTALGLLALHSLLATTWLRRMP